MSDEVRRPLLYLSGEEAAGGLRVDVMADGQVRLRVLPSGPQLFAETLEEAAVLAWMLPGVRPAVLEALDWELALMGLRGEPGS